jgi:hypothetical protein
MGVWRGVASKYHLGLPCPTLICSVGRPPLQGFQGFRGGLPSKRAASGHVLHLWTPYAVRLWTNLFVYFWGTSLWLDHFQSKFLPTHPILKMSTTNPKNYVRITLRQRIEIIDFIESMWGRETVFGFSIFYSRSTWFSDAAHFSIDELLQIQT